MIPVAEISDCCSNSGPCECGTGCKCASVLDSTLADEAASSLAGGFAALADPARLKLVSLLATAPDGAVCICDLTGPLGKSQSTVSHHMKVLADAGLVIGEKQGRLNAYRIVNERIEALKNSLTKEHTHD